MTRFAIIGFGEVGALFARDLHRAGAARIGAHDIAAEARGRAAASGHATVRATAAEATAEAEVVFVAVTAGAVAQAMASLAGGLGHRPFVVDVNSVSPDAKRTAGRIVEQAGGRYVEAAVMASVPPQGLRTPMLLGGPHAADWQSLMVPFDMRLEVFGDGIGGASAVKMCRSVLIKGLEALLTESMIAARRHGVEDRVLASLTDTLPHADWPGLARYMIGRALVHGRRRAEEMGEVALTVAEAGIAPALSHAVARRQRWAFDQGRRLPAGTLAATDLGALLDAIAALPHSELEDF